MINQKPLIGLADYLINKHNFSVESALKASSAISHLKKPKQADSVLSFLKQVGFSKIQIEKVIQVIPRVLSSNLAKTIEHKIKLFQDSGFSASDISEIISSDPWILTRSAVNRLGPSISSLKTILGSDEGISEVLKSSGSFLKHDLEKTLIPNIEFLKNFGITESLIIRYALFIFPRFLLHKPERIIDFVERVDKMGMDRKSNKYLSAVWTISSMSRENWDLKLKLFQTLGFSKDEILRVFIKKPQVFALSEKKIRDGIQALISAEKCGISYVIKHPELLIFSVERRLKPRLKVLDVLVKKNVIQKRLTLSTMCKMSDKKFVETYVSPYLDEVGELYQQHVASGLS